MTPASFIRHDKSEFGLTRPLLIWLVTLLLIRLLVLLNTEVSVFGDGVLYLDALQTIISTGSLPDLRVQPVGYPAFLSVFHIGADKPSLATISNIHKFMDMGIVVVLSMFCLIFTKGRHLVIRAVALCAMILQPFTGAMLSSVYTEHSATFLSFIGVVLISYLAVRTKSVLILFLGGLLLGVASSMRVDLLIMNIGLAGFLIFILLPRIAHFKKISLLLAFFSTMIMPTTILAWQAHSTGEMGFVVKKFYFKGYMDWLRTWPSDRAEHAKFAFFYNKPDRDNRLDIESYPAKAFSDDGERIAVERILSDWNKTTYSPDIDQRFSRLADAKSVDKWFSYYVLNPMFRMGHYWVNADGSQFYLRTIGWQPPLSTIIVVVNLILRLMLLVLFLLGAKRVFAQECKVPEIQALVISSVAYVAFRTLELGIGGTQVWAGLMEPRFVLVAFPFLIIVAAFSLATRFEDKL